MNLGAEFEAPPLGLSQGWPGASRSESSKPWFSPHDAAAVSLGNAPVVDPAWAMRPSPPPGGKPGLMPPRFTARAVKTAEVGCTPTRPLRRVPVRRPTHLQKQRRSHLQPLNPQSPSYGEFMRKEGNGPPRAEVLEMPVSYCQEHVPFGSGVELRHARFAPQHGAVSAQLPFATRPGSGRSVTSR